MSYFKKFTDFCAGFAAFSGILFVFRRFMAYTPAEDISKKEKLKAFLGNDMPRDYRIWLALIALFTLALIVSLAFRRLPWVAFAASILPLPCAVMMFQDGKLYEYPMLYIAMGILFPLGNLAEALRLDRLDGKRRGVLCPAISALASGALCLAIRLREKAVFAMPEGEAKKPFDLEIFFFSENSDMKVYRNIAILCALLFLADLIFRNSPWVPALFSTVPFLYGLVKWNGKAIQVHGDLLLTYLSVCLVAHLIVTFSETCLRKKDMPARTPDAFRE